MRFPLRLLPRVVSGHFPNFLSLFCLLQTVANAKRWSPLWRHIWAKTTAMVSPRTQPFAGGLGVLQSQPRTKGLLMGALGGTKTNCKMFCSSLSKTEVDYQGEQCCGSEHKFAFKVLLVLGRGATQPGQPTCPILFPRFPEGWVGDPWVGLSEAQRPRN